MGARVAWLAERHVAAKRYLVTTNPEYEAKLTEVSARTLQAQGGAEVAGLEDYREELSQVVSAKLAGS